MRQYHKAMYLIHQGKYKEAIDISQGYEQDIIKAVNCEQHGYFFDSLTIAQQVEEETDNELHILAQITEIYALWRLNNHREGKKIAQEVLESLDNKSDNNKYLLAKAYNIHGLLLWKQGLLEEAQKSIEQAIEIRNDIGNEIEIVYSINNLGNVKLKKHEVENAGILFQKAMQIRKKIGFTPGLAASFSSLARYHSAIQEYQEAIKLHNQSLELWNELKNRQFMGKEHRFLFHNYLAVNDIKKAKHHIDEAISCFRKIPNQIDWELALKMKREAFT